MPREGKGQRARSPSSRRRLEQPRRRVIRPDVTGRDRQLDLLPCRCRHRHPLIEVRPVELAHGRLDHVPAHDQQRAADARHVERRRGGVAIRFGRGRNLRDDIEAAQVGRRRFARHERAREHDSSQDQTASLHAKPPGTSPLPNARSRTACHSTIPDRRCRSFTPGAAVELDVRTGAAMRARAALTSAVRGP